MSNRLAQFRAHLGVSQKAAAARFRVGLRTWNRYESGTREPKGVVLARLAKAGLNISWLFGGDAAGPMLLEGEKRATHADLVGDFAGDPASTLRHEKRQEEAFAAMKQAQALVTKAVSDVGFDPGGHVVQALVNCVWLHGLQDKGVLSLLAMMRLQAAEDEQKSGS